MMRGMMKITISPMTALMTSCCSAWVIATPLLMSSLALFWQSGLREEKIGQHLLEMFDEKFFSVKMRRCVQNTWSTVGNAKRVFLSTHNFLVLLFKTRCKEWFEPFSNPQIYRAVETPVPTSKSIHPSISAQLSHFDCEHHISLNTHLKADQQQQKWSPGQSKQKPLALQHAKYINEVFCGSFSFALSTHQRWFF